MGCCVSEQVLPVVIFFSSIISLLSYGGVVQFVVRKISWVFQVTMATSAAESLVAAGNIFLSQVGTALQVVTVVNGIASDYLYR